MNCFRLACWIFVLTFSLVAVPSALLRAQENAELLELVVGLLNDDDKEMRAVGLEQVRTELKGEAATQQLLALLPKLKPEAQTALIGALGDRGDISARPALVEIVTDKSRDVAVQAAAVRAIGALGSEADLPMLVGLLSSSVPELKAAARASLVQLRGRETLQAMSAAMTSAAPPIRITLMEILVERRAAEAIPNLLTAAVEGDSAVRIAAMKALGQIGTPEQLSGMVAGVLKAEAGKEREAAEKAVMFVCQRIEKVDDRPIPLLAAIEKQTPADQLSLLSTLGRVGGAGALTMIEGKIASANAREHEIGIRALCNWPDATIADRLLELIKSEKRPELGAVLLSALIRVAPLPDRRTPEDRLALLQTAMKLCTKDSERNLVLKRAPAIRSVETLRWVLTFFDKPELAVQAHEAVVELAHHRNLREPNKVEFTAALDKVLAASKNEIVRERAQRYKNGQTWDRKSVGE
ncbi:MAG: HEAT repeat domain-containing protein [Pirellulaceae bacterium]